MCFPPARTQTDTSSASRKHQVDFLPLFLHTFMSSCLGEQSLVFRSPAGPHELTSAGLAVKTSEGARIPTQHRKRILGPVIYANTEALTFRNWKVNWITSCYFSAPEQDIQPSGCFRETFLAIGLKCLLNWTLLWRIYYIGLCYRQIHWHVWCNKSFLSFCLQLNNN